jgi:hypothetical protein
MRKSLLSSSNMKTICSEMSDKERVNQAFFQYFKDEDLSEPVNKNKSTVIRKTPEICITKPIFESIN